MTVSSAFKTDNHGWAELMEKRQGQPPLSGNHRAPWVVVGAGVTGLACARRLAELHPNDEILLLEARLVGQGASGRNSGFAVGVSHFTGGYKHHQIENYRRVNRINQNGLDLLQAQVDAHDIGCQWQASGFHHTAADKRSLRECAEFIRYLEAMEIVHTPLDAQALKQRLGTDLYQRGVHVPNGVLLQPAALVRGLADGDAKIAVTVAGKTATVNATVSDAAVPRTYHFENDIVYAGGNATGFAAGARRQSREEGKESHVAGEIIDEDLGESRSRLGFHDNDDEAAFLDDLRIVSVVVAGCDVERAGFGRTPHECESNDG